MQAQSMCCNAHKVFNFSCFCNSAHSERFLFFIFVLTKKRQNLHHYLDIHAIIAHFWCVLMKEQGFLTVRKTKKKIQKLIVEKRR